MPISIAMTSVPKPPVQLLRHLSEFPTTLIADVLARPVMATGLRSFDRSDRLVGVAFTVRSQSGSCLAIRSALELVGPTDVLVIDAGGDLSRAVVNEPMRRVARESGAAGFVLDGAFDDALPAEPRTLPFFARATVNRQGSNGGSGEINLPVMVGGIAVRPGDIVVGDESGVLAFPVSMLLTTITAARSRMTRASGREARSA